MQSSFYWSAYLLQMLAIGVAKANDRHDLVAEYTDLAHKYLDEHFDAIEKHLERIGAFNNG